MNGTVTNGVATAQNAAATVTAELGRQLQGGSDLWNQITTWLAEKGVAFAVNVLAALVILLVGALVIRGIVALVRKAVTKSQKVKPLLEDFICSVTSKCLWAFLMVVVLGRLGVDVGPLVAGLGVTGFVLGFAFKESLSNLAAGMMIAINQPFSVGDYIQAAGHEGAVKKLDMMATTLATGDNKKIVIPNNSVWGGPIVNFSANETRRVDLAIGIAYGEDINKAKKTAVETLAKVKGVLADPAPFAEVKSFEDSEIALALRVWCKNADYWSVFFAANQKVKEAFDREGIDVPYPQLDVHMVADRNS